jgi:hypothetical protein
LQAGFTPSDLWLQAITPQGARSSVLQGLAGSGALRSAIIHALAAFSVKKTPTTRRLPASSMTLTLYPLLPQI